MQLRRENYGGSVGAVSEITIDPNETTPWILINKKGSVTVNPVTGTIRAEITSSLPSVIREDNSTGSTNTIVMSWAVADTPIIASQEFDFVTAVRFVSSLTGTGSAHVTT